ncbi:hypothetical protein D0T49_09210 [Paludibacter sp. 221]|uniref:DUF6089 family protein n=1 Tax=Paludibacter sp. 221 TaxID=2302939 RepID=UPI0013D272D9|nr:DUF6089 family protein [Paludibacter sp. 221]NDV47221.1 hypothetical protein [Paludibacter sp. 221]
MYSKSGKFLIISVFLCFCSLLHAQRNDYRAEIGLLGGVAYYMGDANLTPFKNITPDYGALFRYRFDTRLAARLEYSRTSVKGGADLTAFDNPLNMVDLCGEFNFFDLEKNKYKRFSKIFSPYIFLGVGMMNYKYEATQQKFGVSIPFGVGIKVKMGGRFNFNAQFSNRLLLKDNMEGIAVYNDQYGLNGSNFLNNDLLSALTVGITFDIWKKECDCLKF